ncbi:sensor histidine kinase [Streptococcus sciuri]|uniref:Sensor histidine kinase n=1 Tax=Streptococcus sciuri TaxID=2973939 RepID=A0ABT2F7W9_9STRE|nr:sensor histidine kinase [Streptococcus sciuri]MCS4488590.1 sensor histidine kinase [Streptococcus sciuri]
MKKHYYLLLLFYAFLTVLAIVFVTLDSLKIDLIRSFKNIWLVERFIFSMFFITISLTLLLFLFWVILDDLSKRQINLNLRRILANTPLKVEEDTELNTNLKRLSKKMEQLTTSLQNTENIGLLNGEEIIKKERGRIARDLHDTVSQDLFASTMILSGLIQTVSHVDKKVMTGQLQIVEEMLEKAQNDLRILLLHLRPIELENRTLSEGFDLILKELTDKSNIQVVYENNVTILPKKVEDNVFRIGQEFISNTLKHAKATRLEVYLHQTKNNLQLKMVDDGIGFDIDEHHELSYGLKNIRDRVEDLAGTVQLLSQVGKGTSLDVRLPLIDEKVHKDIQESENNDD